MICARKSNDFALDYYVEDDTWIPRNGNLFCSYCGSLSSDDFIKLVEQKVELTPTDKSDKVYVGVNKFYFQHLVDEDKAKFLVMLNACTLKIAYSHYFYVLPYFIESRNGRYNIKGLL